MVCPVTFFRYSGDSPSLEVPPDPTRFSLLLTSTPVSPYHVRESVNHLKKFPPHPEIAARVPNDYFHLFIPTDPTPRKRALCIPVLTNFLPAVRPGARFANSLPFRGPQMGHHSVHAALMFFNSVPAFLLLAAGTTPRCHFLLVSLEETIGECNNAPSSVGDFSFPPCPACF